MVFCGCAACPYDPRIFKFSMDVLASLLILFKRFAHPAGPTQDASFEPRAYKPRAEKENKAKLVAAFEPRAYKPRADWKKVARLERPYQKHNVFYKFSASVSR